MTPKKLALKKEALADLTPDELTSIVAGDGTETYICWVKTFTQFSVCSLC